MALTTRIASRSSVLPLTKTVYPQLSSAARPTPSSELRGQLNLGPSCFNRGSPRFNEDASIGLRPRQRVKVAKDHRGEDDPAGEVEPLSASQLHDCLSARW